METVDRPNELSADIHNHWRDVQAFHTLAHTLPDRGRMIDTRVKPGVACISASGAAEAPSVIPTIHRP